MRIWKWEIAVTDRQEVMILRGVEVKDFITRFKNARKVIQQIRSGEWVPRFNSFSCEHLTAKRDGLELWLGNGSFFCEIRDKDCFGLFWRHYVWWSAARKLKADADNLQKKKSLLVL